MFLLQTNQSDVLHARELFIGQVPYAFKYQNLPIGGELLDKKGALNPQGQLFNHMLQLHKKHQPFPCEQINFLDIKYLDDVYSSFPCSRSKTDAKGKSKLSISVEVVNKKCQQVCRDINDAEGTEGTDKIMLVSLANSQYIGGDPFNHNAQEESIFQHSDITSRIPCQYPNIQGIAGLTRMGYVWWVNGVQQYALMDKNILIHKQHSHLMDENVASCSNDGSAGQPNYSVLFVAAPDLQNEHYRQYVLTPEGRREYICYMALMMRLQIEACIAAGKNVLITGALGCGVFNNNPVLVAAIFRAVLEEYKGIDLRVKFSVYDPSLTGLYDTFNGILSGTVENAVAIINDENITPLKDKPFRDEQMIQQFYLGIPLGHETCPSFDIFAKWKLAPHDNPRLNEMETCHNWVQWIFPTDEKSKFYKDAPLANENLVRAFREDVMLRERFEYAFMQTLDFYKLHLTNDGIIENQPLSPSSRLWWMQPGDHNHLRLTRMAKSAAMLGFSDLAQKLCEYLFKLSTTDSQKYFTPETRETWSTLWADRHFDFSNEYYVQMFCNLIESWGNTWMRTARWFTKNRYAQGLAITKAISEVRKINLQFEQEDKQQIFQAILSLPVTIDGKTTDLGKLINSTGKAKLGKFKSPCQNLNAFKKMLEKHSPSGRMEDKEFFMHKTDKEKSEVDRDDDRGYTMAVASSDNVAGPMTVETLTETDNTPHDNLDDGVLISHSQEAVGKQDGGIAAVMPPTTVTPKQSTGSLTSGRFTSHTLNMHGFFILPEGQTQQKQQLPKVRSSREITTSPPRFNCTMLMW